MGLERLDGKDVTRSERLEALRERPRLAVELQQEIKREKKEEEEREHKQRAEGKDEKEGAGGDEAQDGTERDTRFTPALRLRMYEEQKAAEAKQQAEAAASSAKFSTPVDLYTQAKQKLNTFLDPTQYTHDNLPSQRNTGRYPFTLTPPSDPSSRPSDPSSPSLVLRVQLPRHMDTSSVRVDVQPWWVQVDIRGQLLVLHTEQEVAVGAVSVKRVVSDGSLVVSMPVVKKEAVAGVKEREGKWRDEDGQVVEEAKREEEQVVVMRGKVKNGSDGKSSAAAGGWEGKSATHESKQAEHRKASAKDKIAAMTAGLTELSVTRSVTLEAKRQMEQEAAKQRQSQHQQRTQLAVDDDDVPPLI